ncbi:N-acetylmuramoyl-L-alanine amidase [Fictibacillus aquaticus]|uniref:N-acetylmuramoyl-L-alanine amidase n=1 Tax=Fictibacillus aquaticus TaxID=2021314 RepID=UPI0013FD8F9D|nr:N-acetylmuramoyl-L-alanine amidase [Fictibacillus aquaticus]
MNKYIKGLVAPLAAAIAIAAPGPSASAASFTDISSTFRAKEEIDYLSLKDVITGYADGTFKPGQSVNRAETAVMIGRALKLDGTKRSSSFSDVSSASFASGYIKSAVEKGIITGYADGTFRPGKTVNRSEMAILIARAFKLAETNSLMLFGDVPKSSAAYGSINKIASAGIAAGFSDNTFRPNQSINRADFSVFMARSMNTSFRIEDADDTATIIGTEIVNTNDLNVRKGPSTDFSSIGKLNMGDRVSVYQRLGDWALVEAKGLKGYVHQAYIAPPVADLDLKRIVVDAGHGGSDSGAVGNGLTEEYINLDTSLRLEKRLKLAGVNVIMTRRTDAYPTLSERVQIAKDGKGEMFISIHTNSGGGTGAETYYYGASEPASPYSAKSKKLAELIQKRMVSILGVKDRGYKHGDFHVIRENPMVGNLVELGFIDSATDAKNLGSATWRDKASYAIYLGILDYYKIY